MRSGAYDAVRQQVAEVSKRMAEAGLVCGTSGNVSARLTDGLLAITPMGGRCGDMSAEEVVVVDRDLTPIEGNSVPSSESLLHLSIYQARPDVGGIVHTHAVFCSVAAVTGLEIPPIVDEMVVALGGTVRVADYAPPASEEVADRVCAALGERDAALMRNHGAVAVGVNPSSALETAILLERAAKIFVLSSILGRGATLPGRGGTLPDEALLPDDVVQSEAAIFDMRRKSRIDQMP